MIVFIKYILFFYTTAIYACLSSCILLIKMKTKFLNLFLNNY